VTARARLVIADDHHLVAEGIRGLVEREHDVVGVAHSGLELLTLLGGTEADCVLLDLSMPDGNGLELLPDLRALRPDLRILVVTQFVDRVLAEAVLSAGAHGFIPKDAGSAELLEAIGEVLAGRRFLSRRVPTSTRRVALGALHEGWAELTPRQQDIVRMIGEGLTSQEIGERLGLTHRTVSFHREKVRKKLGVDSQWGLLRVALLVRAAEAEAAGAPLPPDPER
jgi:DNA-binding NarL/FixJ family response regulator